MWLSDEDVYAKYADELLRFAATLAGPSGAEDLLSASVLKAMTSPYWSSVTSHRAYLYRAVLNEARQVNRATTRRLAREARVARSDEFDPSGVRVEVLAAMSELSLEQRAVVFMTYWLDQSIEEVADSLGLSRRTTERRLRSARTTLRGALL